MVPAGQNVRMDVLFLERAFRACEMPWPFDYHVIDLATLYYAWSLVAGETVQTLSLRQAATTAGLVQGAVPHRALADARLTLETFRHYVGRLAPRRAPEETLARRPPLRLDALTPLLDGDAVEASEHARSRGARAVRASAPGSPTRSRSARARRCASTSTLRAMAQIQVHDAARVHLADRGGEAIDEAGGQLARESSRHALARPVLDREGQRVDTAEQLRHREGAPRDGDRRGSRGS